MAPMSKIDDGTNDITLMNMDKSRYQFVKLLLQQDNGEYFNGIKSNNPGDI